MYEAQKPYKITWFQNGGDIAEVEVCERRSVKVFKNYERKWKITKI